MIVIPQKDVRDTHLQEPDKTETTSIRLLSRRHKQLELEKVFKAQLPWIVAKITTMVLRCPSLPGPWRSPSASSRKCLLRVSKAAPLTVKSPLTSKILLAHWARVSMPGVKVEAPCRSQRKMPQTSLSRLSSPRRKSTTLGLRMSTQWVEKLIKIRMMMWLFIIFNSMTPQSSTWS